MLSKKKTHAEIVKELGCSFGTISRAKQFTVAEIMDATNGLVSSEEAEKIQKSVPGVQLDLDKFIVQGLSSAPITLKAKMVYYLTTGSLRSMSLPEFAMKIIHFWQSYI